MRYPTCFLPVIAALLLGCGSAPPPPDGVSPAGGSSVGGAAPPALSARDEASLEEAAELARAIATGGVPSPTPELDALAVMVAQTTPELGLQEILSDAHAAPPPVRLRAGDLVELIVFGRDEFSREAVRVLRDGRLPVFLIGGVPVEDLTTDEAAEAITQALEASYLKTADVSVILLERSQASVKVIGQVRTPGAIDLPADKQLSMHSVLSLAGGLEADADGGRLTLVRETRGEGRRCFHFRFESLLDAHLRGREVWIEPDDQLVVPRLGDVYVYGEVESPGTYPLRKGSTIASLLFQAGGLTDDADGKAVRVLAGTGSKQVTLSTRVAADEVVFVPKRLRVYVVGGGVVEQGPVDVPRTGLTVIQAIAEAGWLSKHPATGSIEILRYRNGQTQRIEVPFDEILEGEVSENDYRLQPGDLVRVPERIW